MNTEALFSIGYGLYVLTAKDAAKDNGCIINCVMQITESPNTVAVSVNKQNYTTEMIQETGEFNLSMLTESCSFDIFKRFGFQSGKHADKFDGFTSAKRSENGIYFITEATNAYISCKVMKQIDMGTHIIFIAVVTDCDVLSSEPSVTYAFYHKNIKPKPEKTGKKGFRCKICGYIYEGDTLPPDFVCPLCKHGVEAFEKI